MENIQKQLREAQEADDREAVAELRRKYGVARNQQRTVFAKLIMGPDFDVRSLYGTVTPTKRMTDGKASILEFTEPPNYKLRRIQDISCRSLGSQIGKLPKIQTKTHLCPRHLLCLMVLFMEPCLTRTLRL
jgi:hypothetical protein